MESVINGFVGKVIVHISLSDDRLIIRFADDTGLCLFDDAQNCCENRYMRTDDELPEFIGGALYGVEIRKAPDVPRLVDGDEDCGETHQVQFLVVKTSKGEFVMSSHNEHNGYYGGFGIVAEPLDLTD